MFSLTVYLGMLTLTTQKDCAPEINQERNDYRIVTCLLYYSFTST